MSTGNGISFWKQHFVTYLLHWAVDGERLVHVGGVAPTALAPYNHSSCTVEFLFKLHILLPGAHTPFPELPPFLSKQHTWHASSKTYVAKKCHASSSVPKSRLREKLCTLTLSLSCRLTSCREPTNPAAPSDDQSSDAGWSSLSCRLKAFGWFLQCSRPNGTNNCNSPAAIIVAVSSYTTSDMSPRYQHYFCGRGVERQQYGRDKCSAVT